MKNKFAKIFTILFMCVLTALVCSACSFQGKSAYEIAVENGYSGTVTEWLESLKGENGKDGKDGKDGNVVSSLYDEAVENGFEGSFEEFLATYVKGEKGDKGETGASGTQVCQFAVNKAITSVVSIFAGFTRDSVTASSYSNAGSGVIYQLDKENGSCYIITNYHICYSNQSNNQNHISNDIKVFLYGMQFTEYAIPATYIGGSMTYDIAVLKIENNEFLKNSNATQIVFATTDFYAGDSVVAIGNPEGSGISATSGIISVDSEYITLTGVDEKTEVTFRVLRTDCAINGGNSGGGLFNANGEFVGIVNAKVTSSSIENIGYAIPNVIALNVANNLIRNYVDTPVKIQKALYGMALKIKDSKSQYNLETNKVDIVQTIAIEEITENSNAEKFGFQKDDILVSFTYKGKTTQISRLFTTIDHSLSIEKNIPVTYKVLRAGQEIEIVCTFDNFVEVE